MRATRKIRDKARIVLMRRAIKSKIEKLDNPGFITFGIGLGESGKELREVFLPEEIYVNIENRFDDEFENEGIEALYNAGRRYGWRYTDIAEFPQNEKDSDREIKKFLRFFTTYASTAYASDLDCSFDLDKNLYQLDGKGYSVCRKNGKGYIISQGAVGGTVARIFSNPEVHSVQDRCTGRGDEVCHITCGEAGDLPEEPITDLSYFNPKALIRKYERFNKVRELENSEKSHNDLVAEGSFEYREDLLHHKNMRHVPIEISMPYLIEREAEKIEGAPLVLFDVAYNVGKELGKGEDLDYLTEYMGALGWGDIKPKENGREIEIKNFPWTSYEKNTDFNISRGLISGIVSAIKDEEIKFDHYEREELSDNFSLILKSRN